MENLNIVAGAITFTINNDETRKISFNPEDIDFVENFYSLMQEFDAKLAEFTEQARNLDGNNDVDEHGMPANFKERAELVRSVCKYFRIKVDEVFGENTSNIAFGNINTIEMFAEFFDGLTPIILKKRDEKLGKYRRINREQRRNLK